MALKDLFRKKKSLEELDKELSKPLEEVPDFEHEFGSVQTFKGDERSRKAGREEFDGPCSVRHDL